MQSCSASRNDACGCENSRTADPATLMCQTTPISQGTTRTITTTLPGKWEGITQEPPGRASDPRLLEVGLAGGGQRRAEGRRKAGSNSDSIPISIPSYSYYIERDAKTTARLLHLVMWKTENTCLLKIP